ncbi:MAG: A24 family peptidase [Clostridia bacterium]
MTYLILEAFKITLFIPVVSYASYQDYKTTDVPNWCAYALLGIGLIHCSWSSLITGAVVFAVFFVIAMFTELGGADVKIASASAFVLGMPYALIGLTIGLALSLIKDIIVFIFIYKFKNKPKKLYPLIPFLGIGMFIAIILERIIL